MLAEYSLEHAPTLDQAAFDDHPVKIIQGPVESGKTFWACMEVYKMMATIPRCKDGIRRSRFLVIRSTEGELQRGIMRTWKDIFPEDHYGSIVGSMPAIHKLKFLDVEAEVEFFAFEDASEAVLKKLRSTEYTMVLFNEGQFTPMTLFLMARQRAGRYPRRIDCPAFDRLKRVIMDMNAPRTNDHWVLYMRGDIALPADMPAIERRKYRKPADWKFYVQPPAVRPIMKDDEIVDFEIHPDIENLPYQDEAAILSMCETGDIDDIRRDYMNETVTVKQGVPRYPQFRMQWNVSKQKIEPVEGVAPIIGYDPGLTGAATFWQIVNGQWRGIAELNAFFDAQLRGAKKQGTRMKEILNRFFPWHHETGVTCWGDPYGKWGTVDEKTTYYGILDDMGLKFQTPAEKDNPTLRHEIGKNLIPRGDYGTPKLLICPIGMPTLLEALDGGAVMRQIKREGQMVMQSELVKNKHSHIMESAEYAWWGGGEDHTIIEKTKEERTPTVIQAAGRASPFARTRRRWARR